MPLFTSFFLSEVPSGQKAQHSAWPVIESWKQLSFPIPFLSVSQNPTHPSRPNSTVILFHSQEGLVLTWLLSLWYHWLPLLCVPHPQHFIRLYCNTNFLSSVGASCLSCQTDSSLRAGLGLAPAKALMDLWAWLGLVNVWLIRITFLRLQIYSTKLLDRAPWDLVLNLNRYSFIIHILLLPKLTRGGPDSIKMLN